MSPSVFPMPVSHSMETLPQSSPLRDFYPEDTYPGGGYYPSPFGRTKYWIVGPDGGQKVVLIHGISAPALVFKHVVDALVEEGLQVLVYDHLGRGYSEAPETTYDAQLYSTHLALLMQYVQWDKADIVGFSMGGAIAAAFAAAFPHLIRDNVTFLAAAGMLQHKDPGEWKQKITDLPPAEVSNPEATFAATSFMTKFKDLQWELLPGAKHAYQSSLKDGIINALDPVFHTLGMTSKKRFLVIHGTADTTVPYGESHKIKKHIPQAKLVLFDGASHALPQEEGTWQRLVEELVPFITGTEGRRSKYR